MDGKKSIALVKCVKKYPQLYDTNMVEYNLRSEQDETWDLIAKEMNESVGTCKNKWRSLRACYSRHLRNQKTKTGPCAKKDYYMANLMGFLLPFIKPRGTYQDYENDEVEYLDDNASISEDFVPEQHLEFDSSDTKFLINDPLDEEPKDKLFKLCGNKRQWKNEEIEETETKDENSDYNAPHKYNDRTDDADICFFKSLLPDIRQMTRRQKNQFKVRVINTIEDILSNSSNSKE